MTDMTHVKRTLRFGLASVALAAAGLAIGAYGGGRSGAVDRPAATASLPATNCTVPPPGVVVADWCPPK
jgi:hypothetical protein